MREFMDIFGSDNSFTYSSSLGAFSFDAVWTAMLALNSSLGMSTEDGVKLDNLTMFNYREVGIGKLFYSSAIGTKFLGLTVSVCLLKTWFVRDSVFSLYWAFRVLFSLIVKVTGHLTYESCSIASIVRG